MKGINPNKTALTLITSIQLDCVVFDELSEETDHSSLLVMSKYRIVIDQVTAQWSIDCNIDSDSATTNNYYDSNNNSFIHYFISCYFFEQLIQKSPQQDLFRLPHAWLMQWDWQKKNNS